MINGELFCNGCFEWTVRGSPLDLGLSRPKSLDVKGVTGADPGILGEGGGRAPEKAGP